MNVVFTYFLIFQVSFTFLLLLSGLIKKNKRKKSVKYLVALFALLIIYNYWFGFPNFRESFGANNSYFVLIVVLISTVLGIAGNYVFYFNKAESFSWGSFLRPLVVAPIIIYPIIGTFQFTENLSDDKIILFAFTAFQNGFFWRQVLKDQKDES